jgi:hypothetical protein
MFSATRLLHLASLREQRYIAGHIPFSIMGYEDEKAYRITFLRDPIELALSYFFYSKKIGDIPENIGLSEFLAGPDALRLSNIQTRWIAGDSIVGVRPDTVRPIEIGDDIFKKAVASLSKINFVGLVEKYDESIAELFRILGFIFKHTPKMNVGTNKLVPSDADLTVLADINKYDFILYKVAIDKYERQRSFSPVRLSDDLQGVKLFCSPHRAFINMDNTITANGFHFREFFEGHGCFRWTSSRATIRIIAVIEERKDYVLKICGLNIVDYSRIHLIELFLGGRKLDFTFKVHQTVIYIEALFLLDVSICNPLLEINVPFARRPDAISETVFDERILGCAIKWIYLSPCDESLAADFAS